MNPDTGLQRFFIELSFRGTNYHGWQRQDNAHSVQAELEAALSVFFREPLLTTGAGRTDTGVHAKQFFAHFDLPAAKIVPEEAAYHLNSLLPADISVKRIFPVDSGLHARFDAISRTYEYHIYFEKNPFLYGNASYQPVKPSLDKMNEAANCLFEYEDFTSFCKTGADQKHYNCTISRAGWVESGSCYIFTISANRFLRNMVRAIVGTLLEAGRGEITTVDFKNIIEGKRRSEAGMSVPACGLYLTEIVYKNF